MKIASFLSSAQVILMLLFAGCKSNDCINAKQDFRYMPESYKRILPHSELDTMYFLTNINDTMKSIGQGRTIFFEVNYERNLDCDINTKVNYEGYKDIFDQFEIWQSYSPIPPHTNWTPSFKIYWQNRTFLFDNSSVGVHINNTIFHDSIIINNEVYYRVNEFKGTEENDRLFINKSDGIIKLFNSANNTTWSKIK
jgi:hypothetical protein